MAEETCESFFDCENQGLSTEQGIRQAMTKSGACAALRVVDLEAKKHRQNANIDSVQTFASATLATVATDLYAYMSANPNLYLLSKSAYYDGSKHTIIAVFSSH